MEVRITKCLTSSSHLAFDVDPLESGSSQLFKGGESLLSWKYGPVVAIGLLDQGVNVRFLEELSTFIF